MVEGIRKTESLMVDKIKKEKKGKSKDPELRKNKYYLLIATLELSSLR